MKNFIKFFMFILLVSGINVTAMGQADSLRALRAQLAKESAIHDSLKVVMRQQESRLFSKMRVSSLSSIKRANFTFSFTPKDSVATADSVSASFWSLIKMHTVWGTSLTLQKLFGGTFSASSGNFRGANFPVLATDSKVGKIIKLSTVCQPGYVFRLDSLRMSAVLSTGANSTTGPPNIVLVTNSSGNTVLDTKTLVGTSGIVTLKPSSPQFVNEVGISAWGGTSTLALSLDNVGIYGDSCRLPYNISISNNTPIYEGKKLSMVAYANEVSSYSWSGPNGFSSSLQNPTVTAATIAMSGVYSVTLTSPGGCSTTATTTVVVNPAPPCGNATYTNTTLGPLTGVQKNLLVSISNTYVTGVDMVGQSFEITPGTGKSELLPTSGAVTLTASTTPCN